MDRPPVPGVSFAYLGESLPLTSYPPAWPELLGALYLLWSHLGAGNRFVLYALLKQPGIAADLASASLLRGLAVRWGATPAAADRLLGFWVFFPYTVVITAVWGQFDAVIVALILASLYAGSTLQRQLVFGLGIAVKWVTAIFVPLEGARERWPRALLAAVALGVAAGLVIVPILVQGWSLPGATHVAVGTAHGDNLGMNWVYLLTFTGLPSQLGALGIATGLGFLWVPAALLAGIVASRWGSASDPPQALRALLFVLSAVFLVRWGLYEQYFLYLFALLALDVAVFHPGRKRLFQLLVVVASLQLLANNDLGLRFLAPADPSIWPWLQTLEADSTWGLARAYVLAVLAVAMTISLAQAVLVLARDDPNPTPWPGLLARRTVADTSADRSG